MFSSCTAFFPQNLLLKVSFPEQTLGMIRNDYAVRAAMAGVFTSSLNKQTKNYNVIIC